MSNTRPTRRVTARHPFFACTPERDALFAVQPGIPLDAALDTVAAILVSARDAASSAGMAASDTDSAAIWGAVYLIDMAHAVVESAMRQEAEG